VDEPAEFLLGVAIIVDQPLIALRFLDRVEVAPLDILDQGYFERLGIVKLADDRRDLVETGLLRRPPAPLAGDDLEPSLVGPNDDRLDDAARPDRVGELGQRFLVEDAARLGEIGLDARYRDHLHAAALRRAAGGVDRRLVRDLAEQRGEAAAEAGWAPAGGRLVAHAASAGIGSRPISSRASAI
jgi:hypothetical protein